jgi:hypothetical protein
VGQEFESLRARQHFDALKIGLQSGYRAIVHRITALWSGSGLQQPGPALNQFVPKAGIVGHRHEEIKLIEMACTRFG